MSSVQHPISCLCHLCYRAKKEAEAAPCPATPQVNPAETETATGRIAGREEAEQAPASFEFDAEKYIAAAEALEAGDKPDPAIADLMREVGKTIQPQQGAGEFWDPPQAPTREAVDWDGLQKEMADSLRGKTCGPHYDAICLIEIVKAHLVKEAQND